jgi:hypothetical protein
MKPTLRFASRGDAVAELQTRLNLQMPEELPPLKLDGLFGNATLARVKRFQSDHGLVADGVVGAKTWSALGSTEPVAPNKPSGGKNLQNTGKRVGMGSKLRCSFGSGLGALHFPVNQRQIATVKDCLPFGNITPFGKCHSLYNPQVNNATAAQSGVLKPCNCQPVIQQQWSPGSPLEMVGTPPQAALDMNSVTTCAYGGVITIAKAK